MLSKANTEAWTHYISEKIQQSIDRKSQMTLVFAAFIAVLREGAELILFYKASFSGDMNSSVATSMMTADAPDSGCSM